LWNPNFQAVGDWLFMGKPYKIQAEDVAVTVDEDVYFTGLVLDGWEYQNTRDKVGFNDAVKVKLDYSEMTRFRFPYSSEFDVYSYPVGNAPIYADQDWVYVWLSNQKNVARGRYDRVMLVDNNYMDAVAKTPNKSEADAEIHMISYGLAVEYTQIANGRVYYVQNRWNDRAACWETTLCSEGVDFAENPVVLVKPNAKDHVTGLHVTEDAIYYAEVVDPSGPAAIKRMDLDSGNVTMLTDWFEVGFCYDSAGNKHPGRLEDISIVGEWMLFHKETYVRRQNSAWYLIRLDGTGLHEVGEYFVPEDAPGKEDSTGKWRYELLEDGTAMILGAGSKLKFTGKLDIPKAVDKIPVTAIGEYAFSVCEGFTSVAIPKGVTSIGDYAFQGCGGLTGVTIPEGVTHIGERAFQWCGGLKKVTLPATLASIGEQAFGNCALLKLSVAKKNEVFAVKDGVLYDKVRDAAVE